ncbi:MAG: hypothetical protein ACD_54C00428G0002 [uncultured bacterium]|nr:MAG: hypothetical protein ACD_54C00428G0002 [uncultured bacterium]
MPTMARVASENIPAVPITSVHSTLIAANMQKIAAMVSEALVRNGAVIASAPSPNAHHSGRLSASMRSCCKLLGLVRLRHFSRWRRVKGKRRRCSGASPSGCRMISDGRWPIS